MTGAASSERDGGLKIAFDLPETELNEIARVVAGAGFDVHRYYHPDDEPLPKSGAGAAETPLPSNPVR